MSKWLVLIAVEIGLCAAVAHAFLGEAVGWRTFAGAAVIIVGVAISVS